MEKKTLKADLCVVGAGAAGLSVAAGAARLGLSTVLFEAGEMGGECLNTGCVPSKALLAAARRAEDIRRSDAMGVKAGEPEIDFLAVMAHVHKAIATIAPNDSQERFEKMGVTVVRERAAFTASDCMESDSIRVKAKRFVLATGADPFIPPVEGLDTIPYLTNETLFDITERPRHLVILGGGAAGLEMSQAFRRLGAKVTVIEAAEPLAGADPDQVGALLGRLREEGVAIHSRTKAERISAEGDTIRVETDAAGVIEGDRLFVSTGRRIRTKGLGLEAAGVETDGRGFVLDGKLRTTNKRVFAAGDAAGLDMLTHAASWHASVLIGNFYFAQRTKAKSAIIPRAIYTEPEFAWFGPTEDEARDEHGDKVRAVSWAFDDNDRAIAEGDASGGLKLVVGKGGKILGASILGEGAADMLQTVQAVIAAGGNVRSLTEYVPAYPTRGEAAKRAAGAYYEDAVFGPWAKRLARFLTVFQ